MQADNNVWLRHNGGEGGEGGGRECNQNPWRTPVNCLIFCKAVKISSLQLWEKSIPSQMPFKYLDERFLEHCWQLLQKYLSPCIEENFHSEKSLFGKSSV